MGGRDRFLRRARSARGGVGSQRLAIADPAQQPLGLHTSYRLTSPMASAYACSGERQPSGRLLRGG